MLNEKKKQRKTQNFKRTNEPFDDNDDECINSALTKTLILFQ